MSVKPKKGVDTAAFMAGILNQGLEEQQQRGEAIKPPAAVPAAVPAAPVPAPAPAAAVRELPQGIPAPKSGRPKSGRVTRTMRLLVATIENLENEAKAWVVTGVPEGDATIGRCIEAFVAEALASRGKLARLNDALERLQWKNEECPLCKSKRSTGDHAEDCPFKQIKNQL